MRVSYRTVTGALVAVVVCIGFSKVNDRCSGVGSFGLLWVALGRVGLGMRKQYLKHRILCTKVQVGYILTSYLFHPHFSIN